MKRRNFLRMLGIGAAASVVPMPEPLERISWAVADEGLINTTGFSFIDSSQAIIRSGYIETNLIDVNFIETYIYGNKENRISSI